MAASVVLLLGVSAIHGYCPMSVPAVVAEQTAGAHDCCKAGLTGQKPTCCHSDQAPSAAATLTGAGPVTLPAVTIWHNARPAEAAVASAVAVCASSYSPPATVLRI